MKWEHRAEHFLTLVRPKATSSPRVLPLLRGGSAACPLRQLLRSADPRLSSRPLPALGLFLWQRPTGGVVTLRISALLWPPLRPRGACRRGPWGITGLGESLARAGVGRGWAARAWGTWVQALLSGRVPRKLLERTSGASQGRGQEPHPRARTE